MERRGKGRQSSGQKNRSEMTSREVRRTTRQKRRWEDWRLDLPEASHIYIYTYVYIHINICICIAFTYAYIFGDTSRERRREETNFMYIYTPDRLSIRPPHTSSRTLHIVEHPFPCSHCLPSLKVNTRTFIYGFTSLFHRLIQTYLLGYDKGSR